jgi:hypothetical protein
MWAGSIAGWGELNFRKEVEEGTDEAGNGTVEKYLRQVYKTQVCGGVCRAVRHSLEETRLFDFL